MANILMKMSTWDKILSFFGLYRKKKFDSFYNEVITEFNNKMAKALAEDKERYCKLNDEYRKLVEEKIAEDKLLEDIRQYNKSVEFMALEDYKKRNEELKKENEDLLYGREEAMEFYKKVQEQLSEVYHKSNEFKFPRSTPIPGSTVVVTSTETPEEDSDDSTIIKVKGRSILPDDVTVKTDQANTMGQSMNIIISHLKATGILSKIGQELMTSGAVEIVEAFNKDCTAREVYFQCKVKKPKTATIITYK